MFAGLPIALVLIAAIASNSTKLFFGAIAILLLTSVLSLSGVLSDFDAMPPRLMLLLVSLTFVTALAAFGSIGTQFLTMPMAWLVGFQAFRFPLELMIYQAVAEGVAPPQFTWTGMNYDVIVGVLAAILGPLASRSPRWIIWSWNILGIVLLGNIVTVAILSTPGPLQMLTPDNRWVVHFPFVWLPTICVMAAMFGHIVVTRKLLAREPGEETQKVC